MSLDDRPLRWAFRHRGSATLLAQARSVVAAAGLGFLSTLELLGGVADRLMGTVLAQTKTDCRSFSPCLFQYYLATLLIYALGLML